VITWFRFAVRRAGVAPEVFDDAWPRAVAAAARAPRGVRPVRVAVCAVLPRHADPGLRYAGYEVAWFEDDAHLTRFRAWAGVGGEQPCRRVGAVVDLAASPVIVADEVVLRGGAWLERRWAEGGERLKHVAVARRAEGLTPAGFSARWLGHAGTAASGSAIPERVRGRAYVQHHPRLRVGDEWAHDAITEVHLDDEAGLKERTEWFSRNGSTPQRGGLFRDSHFMAVRERPVLPE
jgi:hypothetical protein